MHSTDLPLVEVAPNLFIKSWGDIQSGRISGAVKKFFTITLTSGDYYHVPEADIEATLEAWRNKASELLPTGGPDSAPDGLRNACKPCADGGAVTAYKLRDDIRRWLPASRALTQGNRVTRRWTAKL